MEGQRVNKQGQKSDSVNSHLSVADNNRRRTLDDRACLLMIRRGFHIILE